MTEVIETAEEVFTDTQSHNIFDAMGVSPLKESELRDYDDSTVSDAVWATFGAVADVARGSAHGEHEVKKTVATEVLRFVYWATRDLLPRRIPVANRR